MSGWFCLEPRHKYKLERRLHTAANISQKAGVLAFPVCSTRKVHAMGVMPPKIAAARLKAREKPTVRTRFGMTSASVATIVPLYMPKKNENHSRTSVIRVKSGATVSQCITGQVVSRASTVMPISTGRRPIRSEIAPLVKFHINSPDKTGTREGHLWDESGKGSRGAHKKANRQVGFSVSAKRGIIFPPRRGRVRPRGNPLPHSDRTDINCGWSGGCRGGRQFHAGVIRSSRR